MSCLFSAPHTRLYRSEQVRALDQVAIQQRGIPGLVLMTRAGQASFKLISEKFPSIKSIAVFCGAGNNAGDGYIVARLAQQAGLAVQVVSVFPPEKLHSDALRACQQFLEEDGAIDAFYPEMEITPDLIVDALFGTGLDRPVTGDYALAIHQINQLDKPVVALDIPSGLNADTGSVMGHAVKADQTITFIGMKQGLYTGSAPEYCGDILFSPLDVPDDIYHEVECSSLRLGKPYFKKRCRSSHKGTHGHVLIVGGDLGYSGAVLMAAEAAARTGAGLVSIATRPQHAGFLNLGRPELMCHGIEHPDQLEPLLLKASIVAIGPGLGSGEWAKTLFQSVFNAKKPIIVDADGLNLLSALGLSKEDWVLTPHPGEAARLLHCSTADIQQDRFTAVTSIQKKYQGICVLKGAGSLIADGQNTFLSSTGNPGMASGGFGDVLTGMIAGLAAQGIKLSEAVNTAVYLHGEAADLVSRDGERGMLALDLMPHIRSLVNQKPDVQQQSV